MQAVVRRASGGYARGPLRLRVSSVAGLRRQAVPIPLSRNSGREVLLLRKVVLRYAAVAACWLVLAGFVPAARAAGDIFPDVRGHWAEREVLQGVLLGFLHGYPDGMFRPDVEVTRAEFVKMVVTAFALEHAVGNAVFEDCRGTWFEPYLVAACSGGVVVPDEYGAFYRPDEPIPRAEAAAYLVRALGRGGSAALRDPEGMPFADRARVPVLYRGAVAEAALLGILKGYPDGTVRGESGCTRAEAVVLVLRAVDAKSRAREEPPAVAAPKPAEAVYVSQGSLLTRDVDAGKEWTLPCAGEFALAWKPGESVAVEDVKGLESYTAGALPDPERLAVCLLYLPCPECNEGQALLALLACPWPEEVRPSVEEGQPVEFAWSAGGRSLVLKGEVRGPRPAVSEGRMSLRRDLSLRWEASSGEVRADGDLVATVWYDVETLWCRRASFLVHGAWEGTGKRVVLSGQGEAVPK